MSVTAIVTLPDVRQHLRIPDGDATNDVNLMGFIAAATDFITYIAGPVVPTTFTETYETAGQDSILLRNVPVLSIESVTEYIGVAAYTLTSQPPGSTVDNYGYSLDIPAAGLLVRRSGVGTRMNFLGPTVVVTYSAGRDAVPGDMRMAALEDIRGLYQKTQQGGRTTFGTGGGDMSEQWSVGPLNLFPRLAALLNGPSRTQSIA